MRTQTEIEAVRTSLGFPPAFANGGPPPPGDLSVSALDVLARCPKQYEHKYVLKTPKGPYGGSNEAMRLGGVVHRVLFALRTNAGSGEGPTKKDLLALCSAAAANVREAKAAYEILRPVLTKLAFSFEHAVAFEEPLRLKFDGGELTGQADRVDVVGDEIQVWDYKTGEDVRDDHDTDPQTLGYLGSIHEATGATRLVFKHWYLVPDVVVTTPFDPDLHELFRSYLAGKRVEIVSTQAWKATPGRACFDCPWQSVCDERAKALSDQVKGAHTPFFVGDDEELLERRQFLKGREELAAGMRTQLDQDAIRPRLAAGRKVIGGGLVAGLRACRATKRMPAAEVVLRELHECRFNEGVENPLLSVPFDRAGLERWARGLPEADEIRARAVMEKLASFDEGGSYVEVRRT